MQIAALRRTFADVDGGAAWIETLPRRGYRYMGPAAVAISDAVPPGSLPSTDKPSIAVLPFSNLSGDPAQDYFSDGITEDIITELSRFRSLFVVARHSSFACRGTSSDIRDVGRRLDVRYVAEGSVRKIASRVRVTVQLLDAARGYNLWTERYDRELEDIFLIQDEIVGKIVAALPGRLEDAGREIARRKQTSNITAYDLILLGNEKWRQLTVKSMEEARDSFRKAVMLDPNYARAHVNIAWTLVCAAFLESPAGASLDDALRELDTALDLDSNDAWSHGVFAQLLFLRSHDHEAETHFRRALALNPNDADVIAAFANILVYWGRWQEALAWIGTAKRLNPFPPQSVPLVSRARALLGAPVRGLDQGDRGGAGARPLGACASCGMLRADRSPERGALGSAGIRSRAMSRIERKWRSFAGEYARARSRPSRQV